MCEEVFEIVKKMDLSKVEVRMALQCAPVITGIKISNLLIVSSKDEVLVEEILNATGIAYYCLNQQGLKTTYLLFRSREFKTYLNEPNVRCMLIQLGYRDLTFRGILWAFQNRYESYKQYGKAFPHEIGILLGYPAEDVEGFVRNKGKNYLYSGYWKVYKDVEEKKLLFNAYESAKEGLIILVANRYDIRSIIQYFDKHRY